jgi:spore maturation protein SpmA
MTLNYIWVSFFLVAFLVALSKVLFWGEYAVFEAMVVSTFDMAKLGFEISIGLTGITCLWMGLMRIGERSGMVEIIARRAGPFLTKIFPDIPAGHPAMTPILMNISANMLGLDNAATPLGLKAMKEMQELNNRKYVASNSQIMFLVINTSGLTIIPITIMMYRAQQGAANPSDIFLPILLSTTTSTLAGFMFVSFYQGINLLNRYILGLILGLGIFISTIVYFALTLNDEKMKLFSSLLGNFIIFVFIIGVILLSLRRNINAYTSFIEGAQEGFSVAVSIIPFLVGMLVAIGVLRASGAMELLTGSLVWALNYFNLESEFVKALPTALMRPLSGSGARGMMIETMKTYGPDSFAGRLSCVFQGSTDTTLYVLAVYFGSVGIRKTRYALGAGLFADFVGILASVIFCYLFFG